MLKTATSDKKKTEKRIHKAKTNFDCIVAFWHRESQTDLHSYPLPPRGALKTVMSVSL